MTVSYCLVVVCVLFRCFNVQLKRVGQQVCAGHIDLRCKFFNIIMKLKINNVFFTACLLVAGNSLHAQTKIIGKVRDATGPLQGATLRIDKSAGGSTSGYDGQFEINSNLNGAYTLVISYMGYDDQRFPVELLRDKFIDLGTVEMQKVGDKEIAGVVVAGTYRPSQMRALQLKKSAPNIVETLAADAIGKLPDRNAAEAVQRIQGVSIERDMGEGRFVSVRGTPIQWSSSTLNGNRLPSASGDNSNRGLQMDIFPTEIIQFVKMAKALTPDLDGDAIGGSVDFITRSAVPRETFSVTAAGGYVDQSHKPSFNGSVVYGNKITDKLSFITTAVIWDRSSGIDNYQMNFDFNNPDPKQSYAINQLQLRDYVARRRTIGFNGALDYKFNDNHNIFFKGLYSQYLDQQKVRETYFNFNLQNVNLQARHADYVTDLYNLQLGGKSKLTDRLNLDWSIYTARSSFHFDSPSDLPKDDRGYPIVNFTQPMKYLNLAADGKKYQAIDWPESTVSDNVILPYPASALDADKMRLNQVMLLKNNNSERDNAFKLDLKQELSDSFTLQGGVKGLNKKKVVNSQTIVSMQASALGVANAPVTYLGQLERETFPYNGGFLTELGRPFDNVIIDQITNNQIDELYSPEGKDKYKLVEVQGPKSASNIASSFYGHENVYAAYLMGNWRLSESFQLLGGVRNEYNDITFNGKKAVNTAKGVQQEDLKNKHHYNVVLPMLHAKWSLADNSILRGGLTRSFARPDFNSLNPGTVINELNNTITEGNTYLKPTISNNADIMFEHYFSSVGIITGGVFYKDLHNIIYDNQSVVTLNDKLYVKSTPENLDKGHLLGFELGLSKRLTELPGFLSHFGVEVNYSFVDSKMDLPKYEKGNQVGVISTTLPKQARNIFNTILFYEDGKVMARIAGNYKGSYLNAIRSQAGEGHYQWFDKNFTLDFSASYALKSNIRLFVEMNNITNEPNRFYHGVKDRLESISYVSFRGQVGVSFNLKN